MFPDGTKQSYNPAGMNYYKSLIKKLTSSGIMPMVTLYHWDLPQALQDRGGWLNDTVIEHFADFADACFRELGKQVTFYSLSLAYPYLLSSSTISSKSSEKTTPKYWASTLCN